MSETPNAEVPNRRELSWLAVVAVGIPLVYFLLVFLWPPHGIRQSKTRLACSTNLSHVGKTMLLYRYEHGTLPPADTWCDALIESTELPPKALLCPGSDGIKGQCSYALNAEAAGKDLHTLPDDMVLLFDSAPGWNQVGGPELLTMDNHKGEGCCVCFADASVRFVKREQVSELKWTDGKGSPPDPD